MLCSLLPPFSQQQNLCNERVPQSCLAKDEAHCQFAGNWTRGASRDGSSTRYDRGGARGLSTPCWTVLQSTAVDIYVPAPDLCVLQAREMSRGRSWSGAGGVTQMPQSVYVAFFSTSCSGGLPQHCLMWPSQYLAFEPRMERGMSLFGAKCPRSPGRQLFGLHLSRSTN